MPITPQFHLSQTETHLWVEVIVKHIRVTSIQVALTTDDSNSNQVLHIVGPPIYALRLQFPHEYSLAPLQEEIMLHVDEDNDNDESLVATSTPKSVFQQGRVTLPFLKKRAVMWNDLDLLGKVVAATSQKRNQQSPSRRWIQQVVATTAPLQDDGGDNDDNDEATSTVPQQIVGCYGFGRLFSHVFDDATRDGTIAKEMLDLPWDDNDMNDCGSIDEVYTARRKLRRKKEQDLFDPDRYLGDFTVGGQEEEDPLVQSILDYTPFWETMTCRAHDLSDQEQLELAQIPYPLLPALPQQQQLIPALLDIIFAFVYDHLFTMGDPTVESAWTVTTLSATLSTLEDWRGSDDNDNSMLHQVMQSSLRRSLVYPYYRNYSFSVTVWRHVATLLKQGRRQVIRCFLQTRRILHCSELYYLGNTVWMDPYLAWLQQPQSSSVDGLDALLGETARRIVEYLNETSSMKKSVGLDLLTYEAMVTQKQQDEKSHDTEDSCSTSSDSDSEDSTSSSCAEGSEDEHDSIKRENTMDPAEDLSQDLRNLSLETISGVERLFQVSTGDESTESTQEKKKKLWIREVVCEDST